jgi:predicted DNA-binding transcriptional regulator AlpA
VREMKPSDLAAWRGFDQLPAAAHVRLPVVTALFSVSPATVWRWCRSGQFPKPMRIGGVTFWNVGELRARMAAFAPAQEAPAEPDAESVSRARRPPQLRRED